MPSPKPQWVHRKNVLTCIKKIKKILHVPTPPSSRRIVQDMANVVHTSVGINSNYSTKGENHNVLILISIVDFLRFMNGGHCFDNGM